MNLPLGLHILSNREAEARIELEARLGPRSFASFFRMAWPHIDPAHLLWNWHIDLLCEEMELAARRAHQELVVAVPPRSLKSQILSVAFPAWVWTWFPSAKFITGSNEMTLATRDAVKTRRLVESEWYQRRWGPTSRYLQRLSDGSPHPGVRLAGDQNNKTYYETTAGGHRFCCTPGSNVTGHGGDFILCDDPHPTQKAESEAERNAVLIWWNEAIPTRLNEPDRGVKIVIQQRVHTQDLAGNCIEKGYHRVVLPMEFEPDHPDRHPRDPRTAPGELLHPERVNREALERLKKALGTYGSSGQLQQRPSPRGGGVFPIHMIKVVDAIPEEAMRNRVRRWDLAATVPEPGTDPDYTVGIRMGMTSFGGIYIDDVRRFRTGPAQVEEAIKAIASVDGINCRLILPEDPGQAGKPIWEEEPILMANGSRRVLKDVRVGDSVINKDGRATKVLAVHEQGLLPTRRIATASGRFVTAALDHPFLTPDAWVEVQDLTPGTALALLSRAQAGSPSPRTAEEFRLAGYFVGDGAVGRAAKAGATGSCHAEFVCHDPAEMQDFRDCVASLGGEVVQRARPGQVGTKGLQAWLRDTGLAGHTAYTKRVPAWVFRAPSKLVAHFIGAYFACDGWVSHTQREVVFYSVSRGLLEDVQHLLLRFGINSTLKRKNGKYLERRHQSWLLRLRQQDDAYGRFLRRIPLFHSGKRAGLEVLAADARYRRFDEDFLPDPVVSVEDAGLLPCRCLTVEDGASFLVRDLVVHNSQVRYLTSRFAPYPVETVRETGSKEDRARSFIAQVEAGNVHILRAPWNKAFLDELETFPTGAHDDQVDAAVGGFLALIGGNDGMIAFLQRQLEALGEA